MARKLGACLRWRIVDLAQMLWDDFSLSVSRPILSRELRALGYSQALGAAEAPRPGAGHDRSLQKGGFAAELDKVRTSLPCGTPIEIWFQDEARIGQKNKITRRWAKRGTRPSALDDQRTKSACIFGAICPQEGQAAGLVAASNARTTLAKV
ncbi:hypothetical protein KY084_15975 [Stakelama sp. CBK3Z-3]|uniref:Winged helix-turn helix domain-containing protein n=1 Tax=Stakelama flava TaxID=2860338 RepID=A0ABS6XQ36_9SPHN|nr:hypothetical protein [Stakelama flava]